MPRYKGVQGGTPTGPPLCRTCTYAHYTQGASLSDVHLFCQVAQRGLRTEKFECTQYEDKRHATLNDMRKTAWYLRTDEFQKSIGFVSPQEWRKRFRRDEDEAGLPE